MVQIRMKSRKGHTCLQLVHGLITALWWISFRRVVLHTVLFSAKQKFARLVECTSLRINSKHAHFSNVGELMKYKHRWVVWAFAIPPCTCATYKLATIWYYLQFYARGRQTLCPECIVYFAASATALPE